MIRIIAVRTDATAAANVGGPPSVSYRTFEAECPALEEWLAEPSAWKGALVEQSVVGVEIVAQGTPPIKGGRDNE